MWSVFLSKGKGLSSGKENPRRLVRNIGLIVKGPGVKCESIPPTAVPGIFGREYLARETKGSPLTAHS